MNDKHDKMITYRKATKSDVPLLVSKRVRFLCEFEGKMSPVKLKSLKASLRDYFVRQMASGQFIAWLAFDRGRVIATSGLCFYEVPPTAKNVSGKVAYVMNMFTMPKYRHKGMARLLFLKILKEARRLGYRKISLHASKAGEHLYRTCGFEEPSDIELVRFDD